MHLQTKKCRKNSIRNNYHAKEEQCYIEDISVEVLEGIGENIVMNAMR